MKKNAKKSTKKLRKAKKLEETKPLITVKLESPQISNIPLSGHGN